MGTALITGATSGIGREFCVQTAAAGHDLVVVARDEDRLQELAQDLADTHGIGVEVLRADLAEPEDLDRVCLRLSQGVAEFPPAGSLPVFPPSDLSDPRPVGLLVNAAGFGLGKPFLDNTLAAELYGLDVMVRAVMATCYHAGNAMRNRGRGSIINVSSVAADSGMGTYSAHKAWVRSFSEGLAEELRGSGVTVTAMMPGLVKTEFHQRAGTDYGAAPKIAWSSAETVVRETLDAARRGQVLFTPTMKYKMVAAVQKLAPRGLLRATVRRMPHM